MDSHSLRLFKLKLQALEMYYFSVDSTRVSIPVPTAEQQDSELGEEGYAPVTGATLAEVVTEFLEMSANRLHAELLGQPGAKEESEERTQQSFVAVGCR